MLNLASGNACRRVLMDPEYELRTTDHIIYLQCELRTTDQSIYTVDGIELKIDAQCFFCDNRFMDQFYSAIGSRSVAALTAIVC